MVLMVLQTTPDNFICGVIYQFKNLCSVFCLYQWIILIICSIFFYLLINIDIYLSVLLFVQLMYVFVCKSVPFCKRAGNTGIFVNPHKLRGRLPIFWLVSHMRKFSRGVTKISRMTRLWIVFLFTAIMPCFFCKYFKDFHLTQKCAK